MFEFNPTRVGTTQLWSQEFGRRCVVFLEFLVPSARFEELVCLGDLSGHANEVCLCRKLESQEHGGEEGLAERHLRVNHR